MENSCGRAPNAKRRLQYRGCENGIQCLVPWTHEVKRQICLGIAFHRSLEIPRRQTRLAVQAAVEEYLKGNWGPVTRGKAAGERRARATDRAYLQAM